MTTPTVGTVLYDDSCGFCNRWVPFWASTLPPSAHELASLQADLPCPIPHHILELLALTRGFENGPLESLDFAGVPGGFVMKQVFPNGLPLAHDGFGNYWVADLDRHSTDWAPIYYACHDPPVIAFQSDSLENFVIEALRFANPPHESELDQVHEQVTEDIWRRNPGTMSVHQRSHQATRFSAHSLRDSTLPA